MAFTNLQVDFDESLLIEKYAWVDQGLEELYYRYALTAENCDEFQDAGLLREKWAWVDRKLEEMEKQNNKKLEMKHNMRLGFCKKEYVKKIYKEYDLIEELESDEE
jgi:hypothetical protein